MWNNDDDADDDDDNTTVYTVIADVVHVGGPIVRPN